MGRQPAEPQARLLLDIVRDVRAVVSPTFAVAVKINSADFQRGGFDVDDAAKVIAMLDPLGVDVVELSGGSYEAPAMTGQAADDRTRSREAYFLTLAEELAQASPLPLMLTGGIVRRPVAEEVLAGGVAIVGWAAPSPSTPICRTSGENSRRSLQSRTDSGRYQGQVRRWHRPRVWPA